MLLGYIRISRQDQTGELQEDAMRKANVDRIYRDVASGAKEDRPGFQALLEQARPGDTIVVWRLDRLGRSLKHLMEVVADLQAREIHFQSLTEQMDTSTPGGKFTFHLFGALAEMERDLTIQRTKAGLDAAKARGRKGGRPPASIAQELIQQARELYDARQMSAEEIMKATGFKSRPTFYKYVVHGYSPEASVSKPEKAPSIPTESTDEM